MGKQPTKVEKIPEGYSFSHKDEVTGRDIYKKTSSTPSTTIPVKPKGTKPSNSSTPKALKPPIPRKKPGTLEEDLVYIEPTVPTTPTDTIPKNTKIPLYEDLRIDRKLQPPINPNIDYYQYPDPNAGYSKSTPMYFDKTTQRPVDIMKSIGADGAYTPVYTDTLTANEGKYQGTVKQGNPRVTTDPTKTVVLPGNEIDKSGTKKAEIVGTTGFAKGGIVSKIKGYEEGGVIGQNDPYAAKRAEDEQKKKDAQAEQNRDTLGNVMGAYGQTYAATAKPSGSQDSATKSAMGTVSGMGAVGGVVGGAYGIIDQIARPEKNSAEKMDITYDSNGNATAKLSSSAAAKDTAIAGGLLSPSEALTTRMSYEGGMTDVSGKGYTDYLEKKAQEQLDVYNKANQTNKQNQAVNAREAGNLNATVNNQYNLRGTSFNDNKQLEGVQEYAKGGVVSKVKNMYSKGGEIEGKGGPKEDKIEAKVEEGSFVVPAENAELAKGIRKLYLKAPNKKANLKQEDGEAVKLSNGEHLFTPEENEYLESIGIDLEDLAPNAEHGEEEMAKGGLTAKKARMILHDKKVHGKPLTDQQRKFFGAIASGASMKMACGGEVKGYAEGGPVKGAKVDGATWDGKNWISENGSKYSAEGGKKFTDKYNQSVAKEKANEEQKKASEINVYSRKLKEATDAGNTEEAKRLQSKINELSGAKKVETKTATIETPKQTTSTKPSLKAPVVKKKEVVEPIVVNANPDEEIIVPNGQLSPNQIAASKASEDKAIADAKVLNASLPQTTSAASIAPRKKGLSDYIGNFDPTSVVGIGQALAGKDMLAGEKRPEFKATLDPTYNASVEKALQQATFGLSPEQRLMAQQDIENAKRDAMRTGVNYAGGSGTQAFNLNRAAINDAWKAKLGLSIADQDARMAKQKYADVMAADRANILAANKRQAFNDAMSTFQQKQKAGSELVGAGLQNIIGAYRFNQDQKAIDKANAERNAWTRNI